jgi:hypothetical protein
MQVRGYSLGCGSTIPAAMTRIWQTMPIGELSACRHGGRRGERGAAFKGGRSMPERRSDNVLNFSGGAVSAEERARRLKVAVERRAFEAASAGLLARPCAGHTQRRCDP